MRKKLLIGLVSIVLIFLVLFAVPRSKFEGENPWISEQPLVMAHAGGKGVYPDNTMKAFEYSYSVGVDVLEMDLQMTEDRVLVLHHGENNTGNMRKQTNCDTVIWQETYQYLYDNCNMGYNYQEEDGTYLYRDMAHFVWEHEKVYITTLEQVFKAFDDDILYNIEIKADADAWRTETADELYDLIVEYDLLSHVLVATSFDDISEYIITSYPEMMISTPFGIAQNLIIQTLTQTSAFFQPNGYAAMQIPTSHGVPVINQLDLTRKSLIREAHRHNMAVHYWTINDEDVMRELIELGCDGIITDYPELLIEILEEYN